MVIEIAGVPAEVICHYPESERFFRYYRTDARPLFSIRPTDEDKQRIGEAFRRIAARDGAGDRAFSDAFLERAAIHELLAEKLVEHNVLLMHGSALCMDGQAYIFTAKSGTGKSTHARLWRERFGDRVWMINDDKPMLRVENGSVEVFGTPWDGKHHLSRNASAPLKAIVLLSRDETNHIEPMSRTDAFQTLIRQAYTSKKPAVMQQVLALDAALLDAAGFYRLGCNMSPEAARVAWEGMNR